MAPGVDSPMIVHLGALHEITTQQLGKDGSEPMKVKMSAGRRRGRPGRSAKAGMPDCMEPAKVETLHLSNVKAERILQMEPIDSVQIFDEFTLNRFETRGDCKLDDAETKSVDTKSTSAGDISQDEDDVMVTPTKTAVIIRNIPKVFSRAKLAEILNKEGFGGLYNLIYVPFRLETRDTFGYAFVNLVSEEDAVNFTTHFRGSAAFQGDSNTLSVCDVEWSSEQGGLAAHIERYRNSSMMHISVPEELKPAIYQGGTPEAFPPPTRALKKPRASCRKAK